MRSARCSRRCERGGRVHDAACFTASALPRQEWRHWAVEHVANAAEQFGLFDADFRVGTNRRRSGVDQPTALLRRDGARQLLKRGVQIVESASFGRQEFDRHLGEQLRTAFKRKLIVTLTGAGERREQHGARLAELLQAVVHDLRRSHVLELRPQVPQQNLVQRPLEQPEPLVRLHELDKALGEFLILRRTQLRAQRASVMSTSGK